MSEKLNFITIFNLQKELIELISHNFAELSLKLILQFILVISEVDSKKEFDEFTYDLASKALTLF